MKFIGKNKSKSKKKSLILLTLCGMGIGFAYLSSQMDILGLASVKRMQYHIYLNNIQVNGESVESPAPVIDAGRTRVDFSTALNFPGDFYEFTVDCVNDGNSDVMVKSLQITGIDDEISWIILSDITYADGTPITEHDIIRANTTKTYKVSVKYNDNEGEISPSSLIEDDTNLSLSFAVEYIPFIDKEEESDFTRLIKYSAKNGNSIGYGEDYYYQRSGSSDGIYMLIGTESDAHPIYYYHGLVNNNNAYFAGLCWKIVRTTDTGGIKLLYNGPKAYSYPNPIKLAQNGYLNLQNDETYPFTYNNETKEWSSSNHNDNSTGSISFTLASEGTSYLNYRVSSEESCDIGRIYRDDEEIASFSGNDADTIELTDVTTSTVFRIEYTKDGSVSNGNDAFYFDIVSDLGEGVLGCGGATGDFTQVTTASINDSQNSLAYGGYMYDNIYAEANAILESNYIYGNKVVYRNGAYQLLNTATKFDTTHHYSCLGSTSNCATVHYVFNTYQDSGNTKGYYITLNEGKMIEDVMEDMKESNYNSNIKTVVDNWFENDFLPYFTSNSKDYNDYLEDTIWCNDRTYSNYSSSRWNPNSSSSYNSLNYATYERSRQGKPSLVCSNKKDSYTVVETETGNGALTYPVGLLTADEVSLAGATMFSVGSSTSTFRQKNSYLYNDNNWWLMSPSYNNTGSSSTNSNTFIHKSGNIGYEQITSELGVRPSISLKSTIHLLSGGDGTPSAPYEFSLD